MRAGPVIAATLALALHLAAFAAVAPHLQGAQAAGDGGGATLTLAAADPALADLVAEWDRPPDLMPQAAAQSALPPPPQTTPPDAPALLALPAQTAVATVAPLPSPPPDFAPTADLAIPDPPSLTPEAPAKSAPEPRPAPKPERAKPRPAPQPAAPAQQAAGAGGQGAAGQSGQAAAAQSGAGSAAAKAEWGASIRARIERRKSYPADAGGATGKVTLRLVVGADGRLASVAVTKSSGVAALDRAALGAVRAAGRFPKAPRGLAESSFSLPISFAP